MPQLDPEEVLPILGQTDPMPLIIAGGQALNIWAEHYSHAPELSYHLPFTSKDVDFVGRFGAASELAQKLGGYVGRPGKDGIQAWVEAIIVVPER